MNISMFLLGAIIAIFLSVLSAKSTLPPLSPIPPDQLLKSETLPSLVPTDDASLTMISPLSGLDDLKSEQFRGPQTKGRRNRERFPLRGTKSAVIFTKKGYLRKEMCKAQIIKQVVKVKGCSRQTVINRFCYGQCNSFYIPRTDKQNMMEPAFKSCSFCSPSRYTWLRVTVRCHNLANRRFKRVKVKVIKRCRCMAVEARPLS